MTLVYIQGRIYRNDRGCWTFITLLVSFNSIYRGRVVQYHTWLITLKTGANPWLRNHFSDRKSIDPRRVLHLGILAGRAKTRESAGAEPRKS
jgi:hypothetical protein